MGTSGGGDGRSAMARQEVSNGKAGGVTGLEVEDWPKVKVTAGYLCREAFSSTVALVRINTIRGSV